MTLQTTGNTYTQFFPTAVAAGFYASNLIDASGEKFGFVFRVPKTGNITVCRFRLGAVTTGQTLRAGLYTLDTDGNPTATGYGGMAVGTVSVADTDDNLEKVVTFATPASAVFGDIVALVIEFDSTAGNLNINSINGTNGFPYGVHFTTAWAKVAGVGFAIGYDDGTYPHIENNLPFTAGLSLASITVNTATFDEYASRIYNIFASRIKGFYIPLTVTPTAHFEYSILDASSNTIISNIFSGSFAQSAGTRYYPLLFTGSVTLNINTEYRLSIRPLTTASLGVTYGWAGTGSVIEGHFGVGNYMSRRVDQGAWQNITTGSLLLTPIYDQFSDDVGAGATTVVYSRGRPRSPIVV